MLQAKAETSGTNCGENRCTSKQTLRLY